MDGTNGVFTSQGEARSSSLCEGFLGMEDVGDRFGRGRVGGDGEGGHVFQFALRGTGVCRHAECSCR